MTKNLISLSLLDNKGFSFQGEGGVMDVCKGSNVVLKGIKNGALHLLQGSTITSSDAVASYEVGHMGKRGMQILTKRNLLCGRKVQDLEFREHCVFGKLHRSKFPKGLQRTKGTIDYIHFV
ncbi:uncharacterized mitochondrial protein AtMg00300-like [Beta vulgaris subsp. vulgaris]|uniref:uncharacterized mitochondrial protein AtMg00300-like n=1 Tax=Beta vulgaris subsp. vulgaris TaxID=3555 RepID=UPI0009005235|nr:uncharacterized mitochondrial protein AtMg00300-like [Beta vulgaris subsp. vulgaris]